MTIKKHNNHNIGEHRTSNVETIGCCDYCHTRLPIRKLTVVVDSIYSCSKCLPDAKKEFKQE